MLHESFRTLYWREFETIKQGADFFHVSKPTIVRWLDGSVPLNPMAEKLLIIKALGYLPNDIRCSVFGLMRNAPSSSPPKVVSSARKN